MILRISGHEFRDAIIATGHVEEDRVTRLIQDTTGGFIDDIWRDIKLAYEFLLESIQHAIVIIVVRIFSILSVCLFIVSVVVFRTATVPILALFFDLDTGVRATGVLGMVLGMAHA